MVLYNNRLEKNQKEKELKKIQSKTNSTPSKTAVKPKPQSKKSSNTKVNPLLGMYSNLMGINLLNNNTQPVSYSIQYYYAKEGQKIGPYTESDIYNFIAAGVINKQTYLWKTGMSGWVLAEQFIEFNLK